MRNNILTVTYVFFLSGWWGWNGEGRENMVVEGTADGTLGDQSLLTSRETAWKPGSERTRGNTWGGERGRCSARPERSQDRGRCSGVTQDHGGA